MKKLLATAMLICLLFAMTVITASAADYGQPPDVPPIVVPPGGDIVTPPGGGTVPPGSGIIVPPGGGTIVNPPTYDNTVYYVVPASLAGLGIVLFLTTKIKSKEKAEDIR